MDSIDSCDHTVVCCGILLAEEVVVKGFEHRFVLVGRALNVAPQVQDIGLVFGAAYTILEVRDSDGEQLIKLRNPPGDHEVRRRARIGGSTL